MKGAIDPDQASTIRLDDSAIDCHRFDQSAVAPAGLLLCALSFMPILVPQ
jgi:hypothetical protein